MIFLFKFKKLKTASQKNLKFILYMLEAIFRVKLGKTSHHIYKVIHDSSVVNLQT